MMLISISFLMVMCWWLIGFIVSESSFRNTDVKRRSLHLLWPLWAIRGFYRKLRRGDWYYAVLQAFQTFRNS